MDVVCGPMLTMVLADPLKSRRELSLDLGLVAVIQLLALFYGIYSVALGRPVAVVFEKDRYVVVSASEVSEKHLAEANSPFNDIPLIGIRHLSVRNSSGSDEFLESLDLSLQGVSPSMRPNWWQDYDAAVDEIAKKALPLQSFYNSQSSADKILLDKAIEDSGSSADNLYYLPVVSATVTDWIALLDSNYKIVAMEVSDNDVEVCDGVIYRCTAFIVDMQGELIDNFPGVGCFLTFDDAIDEAMRVYLEDYKKIRVMNVGDKVKISDDIDDSDDIAFMIQI